jgi:hypothetical protein
MVEECEALGNNPNIPLIEELLAKCYISAYVQCRA